MNPLHAIPRNKAGFTIVEAAAAVLFISIMVVVVATRLAPRARNALDRASALDQLRDVQKSALVHFLDTGEAPNISTLNALYASGDESKSIIGKYAVFAIDPTSGRVFRDGVENSLQANYVICSTIPLAGAAYVYAYDDWPPQTAEFGTDPVGGGRCVSRSDAPPAK